MPRKRLGTLIPCASCGKDHYKSLAEIRRNKRGGFFCSKSCRAARTRRNFPKKFARAAVGAAIRNGRLTKAEQCQRCDSTIEIQAHHADYSKPLDVIWLCRLCHDIESKEARIAEVMRRRKHFDPCSCGQPAIVRGMCMPCYNHWRATECPLPPCQVPGCNKRQHSRGLCDTHRQHKSIIDQFGLPPQKPGPKKQ